MGAAPSEYDAVIADLENQVIELQSTIDILKRQRDKAGGATLAGQPITSPAASASSRRIPGFDRPSAVHIASDAFFGMSIVDAVKKYLAMVKKPQDTKAIVEALESGGFQHTSKNFYGTVFSVLRRRVNNEGDFVKVTSGLWALTEWYPALRKKMGLVPPSPPAHARPGAEPDETPDTDAEESKG